MSQGFVMTPSDLMSAAALILAVIAFLIALINNR